MGGGEQQSSSTSEARSPPTSQPTPKVEGWDNEEWGSLEEEPVSYPKKSNLFENEPFFKLFCLLF